MIDVTQLKTIFNAKLEQTDSLDAAFKKATWIAYKQGIADGRDCEVDMFELDTPDLLKDYRELKDKHKTLSFMFYALVAMIVIVVIFDNHVISNLLHACG